MSISSKWLRPGYLLMLDKRPAAFRPRLAASLATSSHPAYPAKTGNCLFLVKSLAIGTAHVMIAFAGPTPLAGSTSHPQSFNWRIFFHSHWFKSFTGSLNFRET